MIQYSRYAKTKGEEDTFITSSIMETWMGATHRYD
jgi:hypothetical protein